MDLNFGDLDFSDVEMDPRMLDYVLGLETEAAQLVEGSHLYEPSVHFDQVALLDEQEQLIVDTARHFDDFQAAQHAFGLGERLPYGNGVVMLFHGPSGTGKTMAAEALGHELGRPLRLLTPAEVHSKFVGETSKILREAFDEAEKNDAIVFFDEADAFLSGRTGVESATDRFANSDVNELLGLIERFEGLIVLTTNLAENLDPALRRRVRYRLEFPRPAADLRERLWRQLLPESLPLAGSVDAQALAETAELTGAEVENAVFRAAAHAVVRPGGDTSDQQRGVRQRDLLDAAHVEAENAPGATQSESVGFRAER